uniref:Odorant receptor OR7 n=1 Tax=Colaphellus bowringi TaxID=561076 RepID=A0A0S3J2N3_9CUCU|nr:odorant receptor OR7 [Colaphellus bowringi]
MISPTSYLIKLIIFKSKSVHVLEMLSFLELTEFNNYPKGLSGIVERTVKFSRYLGYAYQFMCCLVITLYSTIPLFTKADLPIRFSHDVGKLKPAVYIFQVIGLSSAASNNSCLDVLAMSLMGICSAQIDILNKKLITLGKNEDEDETDGSNNSYLRLKKCAKHHVEIIRFQKALERVFSSIFLAQFATSVMVICNIGFQLVHVQPASVQFALMLFYFIAMNTQLVMYCWYGNEIIVKVYHCLSILSSAIRDACYKFEWFDSNMETKKLLLIIMEHSKKHLYLTAGKISVLSLESFTSVMRTSYSYFALLQTLYRNNQD